MKARQFWIPAIVVALVAAPATLHAQTPMGTAFTYQGQLRQVGLPVNDTADFEFTLWDDATTPPGVQVGPMVPVNNVTVENGLFTVLLDFGSGIFTGDARWLEIFVRVPAGSGNFTRLSPRQELTPTPYAIYADNADKVDNYHAGNSSGQVAVSTGTLCTNLNADMVDGKHAGNSSGQVPVSNGNLCNKLNADLLDDTHASKFLYDVRTSNRAILAECAVYGSGTYVRFSTPFSYYPVVVVTPTPPGIIGTVQDWTKNGFTLMLTMHDGTGYTGQCFVHWIAIGHR